jgi:hypothetical protein
MSFDQAEKIARAVLYEGYMLYPYRASALKNRQRCSFGALYPEQYETALQGSERCSNRTVCLIAGEASTRVTVQLRFLHMLERRVESRLPGAWLEFQPVEVLKVDEEDYWTLEEAVERQVSVDIQIFEVLENEQTVKFEFPGTLEVSELRNREGELAGRIRRTQTGVNGRLGLKAERAGEGTFRLRVEVTNSTVPGDGPLTALASAHELMRVAGGAFVSLLDPPEYLREAAGLCRSVGTYPVLVGEPGERDVLLSSPIILYDYPQIAPESAGDFFDGTEMDEMLTLRVMTLTDDEKREVRGGDERMRELLERTESTAREQLMRTHGVMRGVKIVQDDAA